MTNGDMTMISSYDDRLAALSVLIAIFACCAARDLGGWTTAARGWTRLAWWTGGVSAMGLGILGIWSMHYIGMVAFKLPEPVSYDLPSANSEFLANRSHEIRTPR